jgi:hypothetical protein
MRNFANRIARLEEALSLSASPDCNCALRPELAVTFCDEPGNELPSDAAEVEKLAFTCPVHGVVGPKLHVQITEFDSGERRRRA